MTPSIQREKKRQFWKTCMTLQVAVRITRGNVVEDARSQSLVLSPHPKWVCSGKTYGRLLKFMYTRQKLLIQYIAWILAKYSCVTVRERLHCINKCHQLCPEKLHGRERANTRFGPRCPSSLCSSLQSAEHFQNSKPSFQQPSIKVLYTLSLILLGSHISTSWNLAQRGCFLQRCLHLF